MKLFCVGIMAKLQSVTPDGRVLLVEVLHIVVGLDTADLRRVSEVDVAGTKYRLLDPIAMLKALCSRLPPPFLWWRPLCYDRLARWTASWL